MRLHLRHRLRVAAVEREAPGVASITIAGRHLDRLGARAGQFFLWRFRCGDRWWHAHPFSLSAAPTADRLRITVKALGDRTTELLHVPVGTRVYAEGPFGTFTTRRRRRDRAVLIAGGIGITPLRALLDELPDTPGQVTVVHRVASKRDRVFADELTDVAIDRGYALHTLVGAEIGDDRTDLLGVPALRELVPDVRRARLLPLRPTRLRRRRSAPPAPARRPRRADPRRALRALGRSSCAASSPPSPPRSAPPRS